MTIISDEPIPSPIVIRPDTSIVMNAPLLKNSRIRLKMAVYYW